MVFPHGMAFILLLRTKDDSEVALDWDLLGFHPIFPVLFNRESQNHSFSLPLSCLSCLDVEVFSVPTHSTNPAPEWDGGK